MNKVLILKKGKTELNFGSVDDIFPNGYHDYDLRNRDAITDIVSFLIDGISKDERKMMVLGAYSPASIQDLELATAEVSYTLARFEKNIHKKEVMLTLSGLISYGFKPIVIDTEESNEAIKKGQKESRKGNREATDEADSGQQQDHKSSTKE